MLSNKKQGEGVLREEGIVQRLAGHCLLVGGGESLPLHHFCLSLCFILKYFYLTPRALLLLLFVFSVLSHWVGE